MAITINPYHRSYHSLGLGRFNFLDGSLKMMLVRSTYVPDVDSHEFVPSVTSASTVREVVGSGYSPGGVALAGLNWTYNATADQSLLTCAPVTWPIVSVSDVRYGVIYSAKYVDVSTDPEIVTLQFDPTLSPLLCCVDFESAKSVTNGPFVVTFANGIYALRRTP